MNENDLETLEIIGVAHIGIAVPSIDVATRQYEALGFHAINHEIISEREYGVRVLMMKQGNYQIELLEPLEKGRESPIDSYIASKPYKMYHLAYLVKNLDDAIKKLEKKKYIAINPPRPTNTLDGARAVFMFNRSMGIIELLEKDE